MKKIVIIIKKKTRAEYIRNGGNGRGNDDDDDDDDDTTWGVHKSHGLCVEHNVGKSIVKGGGGERWLWRMKRRRIFKRSREQKTCNALI